MAKRSKRTRQQQTKKQRKRTATQIPVAAAVPSTTEPTPDTSADVSGASRKGVDFAQEYFYVYREVRDIFIVAIVMLIVLFGLSFVI